MATDESPRVLYVDSSAIVKLVVREDESDALRRHLEHAQLVTSAIALNEVPRTAHLPTTADAAFDHAETVLRRFALVDLDDELYRDAARQLPSELRTLDAIHLASALRLGGLLDAVVAYDRRFTEAARAAGLTVEAPGRSR